MVYFCNGALHCLLIICFFNSLFVLIHGQELVLSRSTGLQLSHSPEDIKFFLYPPNTDTGHRQEIKFLDLSSLLRSSFIRNAPTIFIIPGLGRVPDYVFDSATRMRLINGYVSSGIQGNFIAVGWNKLNAFDWDKSRPDLPSRFIEVIQNSHITAERVTDFICWLVGENVLSLDHVHLIGGSMGAIVSALVGRRVQDVTGGKKVGRITGLDPAGGLLDPPHFPAAGPRTGDAIFTDVFHTNGGQEGNSLVREADMNIIVNNGVFQPGCGHKGFSQLNMCSHGFAISVYSASIRKVLVACECPPWRRVDGVCDSPCVNPTIVGPYVNTERARGSFYLRTGTSP